MSETENKIVVRTKSGDSGRTQIGEDSEGSPVFADKDSDIIELWGSIDELSCHLGCCEARAFRTIQDILSNITGQLYKGEIDVELLKSRTRKMERYIQKRSDGLGSIFVRPMGMIHLSRSVARRVERQVVRWSKQNVSMKGTKELRQFFNCLSDYLYVYAESEIDVEDD